MLMLSTIHYMFRLVEEEEEATLVSDEGVELFTDGLEVDEDEDV